MTVTLAHDVGGPTLPFPLPFALIGTVWVLMLTFVALAVAWKRPRFDPATPGRPLPEWVTSVVDSPAIRWAAMAFGVLFAVWVGVAAVFGPQDGLNPLRGVVFVLLWMGLVPVSLAVGPVWRAISPTRTVARLIDVARAATDRGRPRRLDYPVALGYWPAALALFTFVWLQLASPNLGTLPATKAWLLMYLVAMLVGAGVYGQLWFARADPFEVYSVVASRLSPFQRDPATGRISIGHPLDHLPSMPVRPGTLAVLAVLLGALVFDSFSALESVDNLVYDLAEPFPLDVQPVIGSLVRTAGLVLFIAVVALVFWAAARIGGGDGAQRRRLPGQLAHVLIPVIVAVAIAHTFVYLIEQGQQTIVFLADPLDRGWTLLGRNHADVNRWLSQHPDVVAPIQLACVVLGHVVAVVAAHDRVLRLVPKHRRSTAGLGLRVRSGVPDVRSLASPAASESYLRMSTTAYPSWSPVVTVSVL